MLAVMIAGIVIHGPEAIDTQFFDRALSVIGKQFVVKRILMSGYTGIAAVIDAGLEDVIDINQHLVPSQAILALQEVSDIIFLMNYGKNKESIMKFGELIFLRIKDKLSKPLIQVDNGVFIGWNSPLPKFLMDLAEKEGAIVIEMPEMTQKSCDRTWRLISGVIPGENVWINGIVVGKAISSHVAISKDQNGRLIAEGIKLKQSGVERLGIYDIWTARVRSGVIRRTRSIPRCIGIEKRGYISIVDHQTEEAVYSSRNSRFVVTIGDDTSKTAGSILYRFGIPIIAITDGDEDGISREELFYPGSIVIRVKPGHDDVIGERIKDILFKGSKEIATEISIEEMTKAIIEMSDGLIVEIKKYQQLFN